MTDDAAMPDDALRPELLLDRIDALRVLRALAWVLVPFALWAFLK